MIGNVDKGSDVKDSLKKNREVLILTISCQLRLLLARANVERVKQGQPALSLRRLAEESGVSLSVLATLHTGKSQRIDYTTIDHLLTYFNRYFRVTTDDLLSWQDSQEDTVSSVSPGYISTVAQQKTSFA
jgi:transcriptional regulator with XRE-family HTH domain